MKIDKDNNCLADGLYYGSKFRQDSMAFFKSLSTKVLGGKVIFGLKGILALILGVLKGAFL